MTSQEIEDKFEELPEVIQDHLYDEEIADFNDAIFEKNGLDDDAIPILATLVKEVLVKEVVVENLAKEVEERFKLDGDKAKNLARDIAGYRLLVLDTYLGDVGGYIRSLGGNPDDYPKERIKVEERTTEAAVRDVEKVVEVGQLPHRLKTRFENVLRSYFKGVRTDSQLIDILTREEKVGGVGLNIEAAKTVVAEAQEERRSVIINDAKPQTESKENVDKDAVAAGLAPASESAPEEKSKTTFVTVLPEDEEEIEQLRKKLPKEEVQKSADTNDKIKKSVDEIYKASGVGLGSSEVLQARFKKIIENRLRDIRDQLETLQILVQPKELGGLSLSQDDARRIISLIEGKLKGVHAKHQEIVKENKDAWVAEEARKTSERADVEKKADLASRDVVYQQATLRSKKLATTAAGTASTPVPPGNLPIPSGNASSPVRAELPKPTPRPLGAELPKPPASAPAPIISKQPPASPVRPMGMTPKSTMKPIMKDVISSAPMATGPIEALRTTSLVDFRRLSKIPQEATLKIKDKIDLLGEDSFQERSAGIAAWRESGVFKLYLEMMGEALEGKSMEEVISGRQEAKKDVLTMEEIDAIVQLGIALRA